ncbi:Hypothetical protein R9X50_00735800 [Acrodontium crateriforme]|uniref:Hydrophobic surface binding protein n=1 Tax=Acrodontium crateriforme TaxID=150365 RepID=A0AAQ3M9M6_9PEZI|nr:Hypothetical protein R9X50_00735800 [Acrodontium crateriforme]
MGNETILGTFGGVGRTRMGVYIRPWHRWLSCSVHHSHSIKVPCSNTTNLHNQKVTMVAIKNILFFATAISAAAIVRRDAATVLADLKKVDSDTNALTTAINNYSGGAIAAIPISSAESTLDKDIKQTTSDAGGSVSEADAQTIVSYISGTLQPDIAASLTALKGKSSQISAAGLKSTVENDLKTLKTDTDALGAKLVASAPSDQQAAAQSVLAKIDADLTSAIAAFA